MSFILWSLLYYVSYGILMYVYAVVTSYGITGNWQFKITDDSIGVCKYPKWTLFWLRWIVRRFEK